MDTPDRFIFLSKPITGKEFAIDFEDTDAGDANELKEGKYSGDLGLRL